MGNIALHLLQGFDSVFEYKKKLRNADVKILSPDEMKQIAIKENGQYICEYFLNANDLQMYLKGFSDGDKYGNNVYYTVSGDSISENVFGI